MSTKVLLLTAVTLNLTLKMADAAPILWAENGHYYEAIIEQLTWTEARSAAEAQIYLGLPGHLATIHSAEENTFIQSLSVGAAANINLWLGGFQAAGSLEPAGGWQWVTNEPWTYTNWDPPNPSNTGGIGTNENALEMLNPPYNVGFWNDVTNDNPDLRAYIVEYEGTPIPEPSTILLLGTGLLGLVGYHRRRGCHLLLNTPKPFCRRCLKPVGLKRTCRICSL
jgi:hypothetical protein